MVTSLQQAAGNAAVSRILSGSDAVLASVQRVRIKDVDFDLTTPGEGRRVRAMLDTYDDVADVLRLRADVERTASGDERKKMLEWIDQRIDVLQQARAREERTAKRARDRAEREREAEHVRADRERELKLAAELEDRKQAERARLRQLVLDGEELVGPFRGADGTTPQQDDRVTSLFALALAQVRGRAEPLIRRILSTVHRSRDAHEVESGFTLKVLNGTSLSAASGERAAGIANYAEVTIAVEVPAFLGPSTPLFSHVRSLAQLESVIDQMRKATPELASTLLHELTHLALHRTFDNGSLPYAASGAEEDEDVGDEDAWKATRDAVAELERFGTPAEGADSASASDASDSARAIASRILGYTQRWGESAAQRRATEVVSHLIEIVLAKGMPYVETHLPAGARLLARVEAKLPAPDA
ncbi:hypothetical protein [Agromyces larvae]|uniref:Uncharacterized protein n=1 Tax=Agromyces larvae TaxID=2929802 RepID=A0ABY4C1Z4_9MICO|nr:hypothetical protein [Agromyces larvae]UOE45435.1 hypothetical protein MTO99_06670 [Agromyces larvae]